MFSTNSECQLHAAGMNKTLMQCKEMPEHRFGYDEDEMNEMLIFLGMDHLRKNDEMIEQAISAEVVPPERKK